MSKAEKFWDNRAGGFDNDESPGEPDAAVEKAKGYLTSGDIVLDFGCATGSNAISLAGYAKNIYGLDISSRMIETAQRRANERSLNNLRFSQGTIFDPKLEPKMFDVILAFNILHLLDDAPNAVKQINELLRPGGFFISTTPCLGEKRGLISLIFTIVGKLGIVPHLTNLKFADLENMVLKGGFTLQENEGTDDSPPSFFMVAQKVGQTSPTAG